MKKTIIVLFAILGTIPFAGCGGSCGGEDYVHAGRYGLCNESKRTLTIVHRPSCVELPDYLTIQPGETHWIDESEEIAPGAKSFFDTDPRNIFDIHEIRYDNRYAIDFDDLRYARNPRYRTNYELLNGIYLFTFTVADYTYATRKGKPLVTNYGKDGPAL